MVNALNLDAIATHFIQGNYGEADELLAYCRALEEELRWWRAHRCGLPASITAALNSGDGTYRP